MPHYYNCCVPKCENNFRNAPNLHYYRIPKDPKLRDTYKAIIRNKTLKLDSEHTRICSVHFEGGEKLSRNHLPTIFPWTKETKARRDLNRPDYEETAVIIKNAKRKRSSVQTNVNPADIEFDSCFHGEENIEAAAPAAPAFRDSASQTIITISSLNLVEKDLKEFQGLKKEIVKLFEENKKLREENDRLKKSLDNTKIALQSVKFDIEKYKDSDVDIAFYTGFPDYKAMLLCYQLVEESAKGMSYGHRKLSVDGNSIKQLGRPSVLTKFQEFTLTLMRLRLGLLERDLAHRFGISIQSVSRIPQSWIRFLRVEFEPLITIPPRDVLKLNMPAAFKKLLPNLTVIVDCIEFEMEKPSSLDSQSACYSSYKSRNTMKALLGITPSGALCYVSELFPGSTSDLEITKLSGFLSRLQSRDQVLADKGFTWQDELATVGATLITPNFLKGVKQFTAQQSEYNKTIASLTVHVERLMERIKKLPHI